MLNTLDISRLFPATRDYEGLLAAQYLLRALQRVNDIIPQEIPDDPADRQPYVVFDHPAGQIVIAPASDGDKVVWKFTTDTVQNIRALYGAVEDMPLAGTAVVPRPPSEFFTVHNWVARNFPGSLQRLGPCGTMAGYRCVDRFARVLGPCLGRELDCRPIANAA